MQASTPSPGTNDARSVGISAPDSRAASPSEGSKTPRPSKRYRLCVWAILLLHAGLLARMATLHTPVFDEIAHLPSGLSHWHLGTFDLYRVNPPLIRMIASAPLLLTDPKLDFSDTVIGPPSRPEFVIGYRFVRDNPHELFWYFSLARWALIPVSVFGGWICCRWARELYGDASGLVALLLWAVCPNILAWGATITPDLGAAAFGVAAGYTFWRWLRVPTGLRAGLAGLALGLAELAKSTWLVLFVTWPAVWLAWRWATRHQDGPKPRPLHLAGILALALYLMNLGYGLEMSFQRLQDFQFVSHALGGPGAHDEPANRFRGTWLGPLPVPLPANYVQGIDLQKQDFERGKWSYLRGEHRRGGWWYYYLYALAVKTPVGTLLLLAASLCSLALRPGNRLGIASELAVLLPAAAVLVLVSSQTGFNRYLRYVLPALPFLYVFASRIGRAFELRQAGPRLICVLGVTMAAAGSLAVWPHSMSFFNAFAGGPLGGPAHLLDANVDWGQDLLGLKKFIDEHPEAKSIRLAYFGVVDPHIAGIDFEPIPGPDEPLPPGWYAVSVNHVYGYRQHDSTKPKYARFQNMTPVARVGYSIYVYRIGDLMGAQQ